MAIDVNNVEWFNAKYAGKVVKAEPHVTACWPQFKSTGWPVQAGPQPAEAVVTAMLTCHRPGTSNGLAQALRARDCGATDTEVAIATQVTGNSGKHRNKLVDLLAGGRLVVTAGSIGSTKASATWQAPGLPPRSGAVLRVALPGAKPAKAAKPARAARKPRKPADQPVAPVTPTLAADAVDATPQGDAT